MSDRRAAALLLPGEAHAGAGADADVSPEAATRELLCAADVNDAEADAVHDTDALLLRLTLLRAAAEAAPAPAPHGASAASAACVTSAVCAAALREDHLRALTRLLCATDPVRFAARAQPRRSRVCGR